MEEQKKEEEGEKEPQLDENGNLIEPPKQELMNMEMKY